MGISKSSGALSYPASSRGMNVFTEDENLQRALERHYPDMLARYRPMLESLGAFCGGELDAQAEYSDRHAPPVLERRIDNPAAPEGRVGTIILNDRYKSAQQQLYKHGALAAILNPQEKAPHMLAFLTQYMASYADISTGCPYAMTHPVALTVATLAPPAIRDKFLPEMMRTDGHTPVGGTWATEKHGGSDVARTATKALKRSDGTMRLKGHQWFASAAGFDRWLTIKTARPPGAPEGAAGLGLYLVPSHLDKDWTHQGKLAKPNALDVTDLKHKMGTRGLPTAEVELNGTLAYELAPPGQGLRAMMNALGVSRVHNAMAAAGVMTRSYREALCWASNREAFGRKIITQPMIQKRLLDIRAEALAGTALAFEAARSFDIAVKDGKKQDWLRVATALAKYKTARQAASCAQVALRLGAGNHYTQDFPIERVLRDAEVLAVWEGPEELQALELMRMLLKGGGAKEFLVRIDAIEKQCGPAMAREGKRLRVMHGRASADLARLAISPETEPALADEYLENFSLMLAYALLCEEAAFELATHNDQTKLLVSDYYYERHCQTRFPGVSARPHPLLDHFQKVAAGQPIPAPASPSTPAP